uniref:Uncharacterized protein n=1 Tax=Amphimedon queenslandica TaxID=400682 RepID=A0A1X7SY22_AMPQE
MISESTDAGTISVAIAVPITGLLTGLITAVITSIICLIMRKKGRTTSSKETDLCGPVYDLPVVDNKQSEEKHIDVQRNTAYGQAF